MIVCRVNNNKITTQNTSRIAPQVKANRESNIYSFENRIKLNKFKKAKENMKLAATKLDW